MCEAEVIDLQRACCHSAVNTHSLYERIAVENIFGRERGMEEKIKSDPLVYLRLSYGVFLWLGGRT